MSSSFRRYEFLLPLRFNDGQPVPYELVGEVLAQLREQFGAASFQPNSVVGVWQSSGGVFQDKLSRIFVDVDDRPEHREFFLALKEQLKRDFQQLDIWMTSHPVEIL